LEARSTIRDKASQDYMIIIYHIWRYPNTNNPCSHNGSGTDDESGKAAEGSKLTI
jgi:hypothetical protein